MPVMKGTTSWPTRVAWPRAAESRMAAMPALLSGGQSHAYRGRSRFVLSPLSLTLDQLLLLITAALLCFGLVMVQSADSRVTGLNTHWLEQSFNNKNAIHAAIAMFVLCGLWRVDYRWLLGRTGGRHSILVSPATILLVITICLLLAVSSPLGKEINGARRWLALGPLGFQPSELAKLSLVAFIAAYAVHCRDEIQRFGLGILPWVFLVIAAGVWVLTPERAAKINALDGVLTHVSLMTLKLSISGGCAAIAAGLLSLRVGRTWYWGFLPLLFSAGLCLVLVLTGDFGTTALIALVVVVMLLMAECRWWHVALLIPPASLVVYQMLQTPFRRARLFAFQHPWDDPKGAGYHVIQSLLTIASGSFAGRGLGNGIQKMGYLPEDNTDFIFAVICEELGFFGALLVVGLFIAFVVIGWRIASRCQHHFGKMVAFGITAMIGLQAAINIAVVTASVPTKGIALPLISSGGTGWIMNAAAIGVLMSIERVNRREALANRSVYDSHEPSLGFPVQVTAVPTVIAIPTAPAVPHNN